MSCGCGVALDAWNAMGHDGVKNVIPSYLIPGIVRRTTAAFFWDLGS